MKEYSYGIAPYKLSDDGFYLLVSKSSKDSFYGFVKGKKESLESIKETSIREFFEETNVLIDSEYLEEYFYQEYKRKNIGVFLVDYDNLDLSTLKLNRELYSLELIKIEDLYTYFLGNQFLLLKMINIYLFHNSQYIKLKELFKSEKD